jgi:hypothetical protein
VKRLLAGVLVIAGCAGGPSASAPTPSAAAPSTAASSAPSAAPATPAPTPSPAFPSGIYFIRPSPLHPGGTVELVGAPATSRLPAIELFGPGWDIRTAAAVGGTPQNDGVTLFLPDGTKREVKIPGLFNIVRPALSPDAKQVFVQASQDRTLDTVWIVDLATLAVRRIGDLPKAGDPSTQSEQPAWFPSGDRVAYWAAESGCLVIKVREAATAKDLLTIRRGGTTGCYQPQRGVLDGPRFHVSVSLDSSRILIPGQLQVYDASSGALLADAHQKALDGLAAAGFKPDTRFPGAAGAGTFPLDGSLSPDNTQIVFDGSVEKDGQPGVYLFKINVDGSGFTVLMGPIAADPKFSNNFNFSQLLPRWR